MLEAPQFKEVKMEDEIIAARIKMVEGGYPSLVEMTYSNLIKAAEKTPINKESEPTQEEARWTSAPGYEHLARILKLAHDQAAYGKGAERHANGKPFQCQPMQDLIRLHGIGFATGQASKKSGEALGLPTNDRAIAELLGSINYLVGAIIAIESGEFR